MAWLQWNQVDIREGIVRIEPGKARNREGCTAYLEPGLLEMTKDPITSGDWAALISSI